MTNDNPTTEQVLQQLGGLWQDYLVKTAADPTAQQTLQTMMQSWTTLAAQNINGYVPPNGSNPFNAPHRPAPPAAASVASGQQLLELTARLIAVETRLTAAEHALNQLARPTSSQ